MGEDAQVSTESGRERNEVNEVMPMGAAALWRRYWLVCCVALLCGACVGFLFLMAIAGNAHLIGLQALLGGFFGVVTAALACLGGLGALWCCGRKRPLTAARRINIGAGGAGIAVLVAWMSYGGVAAVEGGNAGWLMFFAPIAIIAGVVTWAAAATALRLAEWLIGRRER